MASGGYLNHYDYNSNNYRPKYEYDSLFLSEHRPRSPPLMPYFQQYQYQPLLLKPANLVRIVNNFENGKCLLKEIFKIFDAREEDDKRQIEEFLQDTVINFEIKSISTGLLEPQFEKWVQVFTKLKLCSYHCKKGKDGRNKKCNNKCGALHLCRTFLLKSSKDCHFRKKGQCMFGHDFNSEHNRELLKKHNLDMLGEAELRQLFRRPNSRCSTTIPQVCRYYNSNTERKCTNKHCMSLHICLKFIIIQGVHEFCSKNHSFEDEQVKKCLDLYEIKNWKTDEIHFFVRRFTRMNLEKSSDNDELASETNDLQSICSRRTSLDDISDIDYDPGAERSRDRCHGCTELIKDVDFLKKELATLKSEVEKLKAKQKPQAK